MYSPGCQAGSVSAVYQTGEAEGVGFLPGGVFDGLSGGHSGRAAGIGRSHH